MSSERISQLRELLYLLERRIKPLEWDNARNQINEFKKVQLVKLKEEFATLQNELKGLEQMPEAPLSLPSAPLPPASE